MLWTLVWAVSISVGFAIEPVVLWHALPKEGEQTGGPGRLRNSQWLVVFLMAGLVLAGCLAWPPLKWVLFTVMVGYGSLWLRWLYPGSMLDG